MKNLINFTLALFLTLNLSACIIVDTNDDRTSWSERQQQNKELIASLNLGTSRSQVIELMGPPDLSEAFERDGDQYRVLSYRTQHRKSDGITSQNETTPLVFKNNKLIGWGQLALSTAQGN